MYGWNVASQRVLLKAGFAFEGTQLCGAFKDNHFTDLVVFAMLRPEQYQSERDKALYAAYLAQKQRQLQALERKPPSDQSQ